MGDPSDSRRASSTASRRFQVGKDPRDSEEEQRVPRTLPETTEAASHQPRRIAEDQSLSLFRRMTVEGNRSSKGLGETNGSVQSDFQSTSDRDSSREGEIGEEKGFVLGKNLSLVEFHEH